MRRRRLKNGGKLAFLNRICIFFVDSAKMLCHECFVNLEKHTLMSQPDEDAVKAALSSYHSRIRSVVLRAWDEWINVSNFRSEEGYGVVRYPRTVANYVFDAIARNAVKEFGSDNDVRVLVEPQTIKVHFQQREREKKEILGRFKKGDDEHLGQNNRTQAVFNFIDAQYVFPGMEDADKVEFIWIANEIGMAIDKVLVVARDVNRLIWQYEIDDAAESSVTFPFPTPPMPDDGAREGDDSLVSPKRNDGKSSQEK